MGAKYTEDEGQFRDFIKYCLYQTVSLKHSKKGLYVKIVIGKYTLVFNKIAPIGKYLFLKNVKFNKISYNLHLA